MPMITVDVPWPPGLREAIKEILEEDANPCKVEILGIVVPYEVHLKLTLSEETASRILKKAKDLGVL